MPNTDFDAYCYAYLQDLLQMHDTGFPLGCLLRLTRELHNIPEQKFARRFKLTLGELREIEAGRTPFPTVFLNCIFVYGLPAWWAAVGDDGCGAAPSGANGASAVTRPYITKSSPR